jgi:hypothetical protein
MISTAFFDVLAALALLGLALLGEIASHQPLTKKTSEVALY